MLKIFLVFFIILNNVNSNLNFNTDKNLKNNYYNNLQLSEKRINILKLTSNKSINNMQFCNYLDKNWFNKLNLRNFAFNLTLYDIKNIENSYIEMVFKPANFNETYNFIKIYYNNKYYYNSPYLKITEEDIIDYYFNKCYFNVQSNELGNFLITTLIIVNVLTYLIIIVFDIKLK